MAQSKKFVGAQVKALVGLMAVVGLTMTRAILGAHPKSALAKKRPSAFPTKMKVSLPTLASYAHDAGLEFKRGRANPISGKRQEKYVAKLVKDYGSIRACEILASDERDMKLFPQPISVCHVTAQKVAKAHGVALHRGRRPLKAAA